jgi:hypothetical protein
LIEKFSWIATLFMREDSWFLRNEPAAKNYFKEVEKWGYED